MWSTLGYYCCCLSWIQLVLVAFSKKGKTRVINRVEAAKGVHYSILSIYICSLSLWWHPYIWMNEISADLVSKILENYFFKSNPWKKDQQNMNPMNRRNLSFVFYIKIGSKRERMMRSVRWGEKRWPSSSSCPSLEINSKSTLKVNHFS